MKKFAALLLVLVMVISMAACGAKSDVMSHKDYMAAENDAKVVVETYVQGAQGWWEKDGQGVITVYCQSKDGAFFAYEMKCSEEDAAKLVAGTKIKITGTKGEWAGEIEIMDGTFEFVEGGDTYIAPVFDATSLVGSDKLIDHQNEKVAFKGMQVKKIEFQNGAPGKDIYVTLEKDGKTLNACVESYLTGTDSDVYTTVSDLWEGAIVDIEGFLYWYEGANPHITKVVEQISG